MRAVESPLGTGGGRGRDMTGHSDRQALGRSWTRGEALKFLQGGYQ